MDSVPASLRSLLRFMMKTQKLFDSLSLPFKGLRRFPTAASVGPGYWCEASNIRTDRGAISLRAGQTKIVDAASLGGVCRGAHMVVHGIHAYYYVALLISGKVRIYVNQYTISSGTWGGFFETTVAASRIDPPDSGFIEFATVGLYDTSEPVTIVQNGKDRPLIVKATTAYVAEPVEAPSDVYSWKPTFGFNQTVDVVTAWTLTDDGTTHIEWDQTDNDGLKLTIAGPDVNDWAQALLANGTINLSKSRQIIMIADAAEDIITGLKWELVDGANTYVIHDPEAGVDTLVSSETIVPGLRMYGFSVEDHAANLIAVDGLKVTVKSDFIPDGAFKIYGLYAGGKIPGHAQYAVAFKNRASGIESAGVVYQPSTRAVALNEAYTVQNQIVGSTGLAKLKYFPLSELFYYAVSLSLPRPSAGDLAKGVDAIEVFRRDPGESGFYLVDELVTSTFSAGTWNYSTAFAETKTRYVDETSSELRDARITVPDGFNEPVPIGSACLSANGRLYTATTTYSGRPFNSVKASDHGYPLRFRSISDPADRVAGYAIDLDRDERIMAFEASSASTLGSEQIHCFTDRACYAIMDPVARRVSSIGAIASGAVAESRGKLFWVDQDRTVRKSSYQIEDISRLRIDDVLLAATGVDKMSGAVYRDRYYLAFSGGVLVWSELLGDWESWDTPSVDPVVFLPWRVGGQVKLYFTSSDGSIYQYESGADDDGKPIKFYLKTPDVHHPEWERITLGQAAIVCSRKAGDKLNTTYSSDRPEVAMSGEIDLSVDVSASEHVWRKDVRVEAGSRTGQTGIKGASVRLEIEGELTHPFVMDSLVCKVSESGRGRDA